MKKGCLSISARSFPFCLAVNAAAAPVTPWPVDIDYYVTFVGRKKKLQQRLTLSRQ